MMYLIQRRLVALVLKNLPEELVGAEVVLIADSSKQMPQATIDGEIRKALAIHQPVSSQA
jgi:hypothetical protein